MVGTRLEITHKFEAIDDIGPSRQETRNLHSKRSYFSGLGKFQYIDFIQVAIDKELQSTVHNVCSVIQNFVTVNAQSELKFFCLYLERGKKEVTTTRLANFLPARAELALRASSLVLNSTNI